MNGGLLEEHRRKNRPKGLGKPLLSPLKAKGLKTERRVVKRE
jgi:hypothetical protein